MEVFGLQEWQKNMMVSFMRRMEENGIGGKQFAEKWHHEEFKRIDDLPDTEPVPYEVITRAVEWEAGKWPKWVNKKLTTGGIK